MIGNTNAGTGLSDNSNELGGVPASNYATKVYVDGLIGDISTILDEINGEVV